MLANAPTARCTSRLQDVRSAWSNERIPDDEAPQGGREIEGALLKRGPETLYPKPQALTRTMRGVSDETPLLQRKALAYSKPTWWLMGTCTLRLQGPSYRGTGTS